MVLCISCFFSCSFLFESLGLSNIEIEPLINKDDLANISEIPFSVLSTGF